MNNKDALNNSINIQGDISIREFNIGINIDMIVSDDQTGGELNSIDIIKYVGLKDSPIKLISVDKKYEFELNTTRNNKIVDDYKYKFKGAYTGIYLINYIGDETIVPVNNFNFNSEGLVLKIFEDNFDEYNQKYKKVKNDPELSDHILEIYFYGKIINTKKLDDPNYNNLVYQITRLYDYNFVINNFEHKMIYLKNTLKFLAKLNSKKLIFNDFKEPNIRPNSKLDVIIIDYNSQTISKHIQGPQTFSPHSISKIEYLVSPYSYIFNSSIFYSIAIIDMIICLFINLDSISFLKLFSNTNISRDMTLKFTPFYFNKYAKEKLLNNLYLFILDPLLIMISSDVSKIETSKGLINDYNPYTFDELLRIINLIDINLILKYLASLNKKNKSYFEKIFNKKINDIKLLNILNYNIKTDNSLNNITIDGVIIDDDKTDSHFIALNRLINL